MSPSAKPQAPRCGEESRFLLPSCGDRGLESLQCYTNSLLVSMHAVVMKMSTHQIAVPFVILLGSHFHYIEDHVHHWYTKYDYVLKDAAIPGLPSRHWHISDILTKNCWMKPHHMPIIVILPVEKLQNWIQ